MRIFLDWYSKIKFAIGFVAAHFDSVSLIIVYHDGKSLFLSPTFLTFWNLFSKQYHTVLLLPMFHFKTLQDQVCDLRIYKTDFLALI